MTFLRILLTIIAFSFFTTSLISQCNTTNLISTNHSFEANYTDWSTRTANGGVANFTTTNATSTDGFLSAEVSVTTLGVNPWDIQIKRELISLTAGVTYELTFDARKSVGSIEMSFGMNAANDNDFISGGTVSLTDSWQSYTHTFTPNITEDVFLYFNYGNIIGTFNLDNVSIKEFCTASTSEALFCKTLSVPGINGTEGGIWTPAIQYDLTQAIDGGVASTADFSAYYKAIWDETNIYLVVNVSDDFLVNDSPVGFESFDDGVELFLDIGNDKSNTYDGVDDHHFLFRWNDPDIYHVSAGQVNPTGAVADFVNTANGYTFEILLPWSLIGNGVQGNVIGIDVQANDDDNGGNDREARLGWNASTTNVTTNPSLFGEGRLDLMPCTGTLPEYEPVLCADLPFDVYHASGLIVNHYGNFWTHNDKQGNDPPNDSILYELDANGNLLREVYIPGIQNVDWEDMAIDDDGNMYVGEFGSGNSPYTDLHIYKIKNPLYFCDTDYTAEVINFRYPNDGVAGDTESMFYWNNDIYLIPKNNKSDSNNPLAGKAHIYKIPASPNPGSQYTATQLYTIDLNPNFPNEPIDQYKIASADLSPDGQTLVMLWGRRFWLVTDFTPGIFLDGTITAIDFPSGLHWQREAVAFADNNTIYTIDEDNNDNPNRGKLGKIELCDILPDHPACACDEQLTTDDAASSSDSAEEYVTGTVNNGSSDLELTFDTGTTGNQVIGLRFLDLGIPNGATIQEAYVQFVVDETDVSQTSSLTLWGEAIGNASAFIATPFNISQRIKTVNSVNWSFDDWTVRDVAFAEHRTADISEVVQEIVNQNSWSDNNAMAFIIEGLGSQTAERHTNCAASAPRLWIRYCANNASCVSTLSILNQTIPTNVYQSSLSINSNGQVLSPQIVDFRSSMISLGSDFEVRQGATFHALIDPCN
jgi:hypothetical protein